MNIDAPTLVLYLRWMTFIDAILSVAALVLAIHHLRHRPQILLMVIWLGHLTLWLGVASVLRMAYGYTNPTPIMSMWSLVVQAHGLISIIGYVVLWQRIGR